MTRWSPAEAEWLRGNYAEGSAEGTLDAFEAEFGRRPSRGALYQKAHSLGLAKGRAAAPPRNSRAEKTVRWSSPAFEEEREWMLENDRGSVADTIGAFERAFGIRLTRAQVSLFRSSHGTQQRRCRGGGRPRVPVGTERDGGKGYVVVKVAEESFVPQGKDNWKLKHVHVWERENGPLPEGHVVMFADRDPRNFDPGNLVAVPRRLAAMVNGMGYCGRESLESAVALARLKSAVVGARNRPRACGVCGREFSPTPGQRGFAATVNTCPECLAAGHKSHAVHGAAGEATCAVCGRPFARDRKTQRRCRECIADKPKLAVNQHAAQVRHSAGRAVPGGEGDAQRDPSRNGAENAARPADSGVPAGAGGMEEEMQGKEGR